jgi:UDP-N-acetylmuramoyl-tripeptide--D-alanyl-D-alanine ligase
MPLFELRDVKRITGGQLLCGEAPGKRAGVRRVSTDSRDVRPGDLFVALKGERFDGHDFVPMALRRGAVAAIVENRFRWPAERDASEPVLLGVPDPLVAYQQLAAFHRSRFDIPVVAVTGSNGKTTTKEMVARVLGQRWWSLKTEANFNNRVGVPQTLLRLTARHEAAVIEMGVDAKGQTTQLTEMVRPTIGLITNIGPDHLEFFGTLTASAESKGELLDLLPKDGAAVLNADEAFFRSFASRTRCRVVSFGLSAAAQVHAEAVVQDGHGTAFRLLLPGQRRSARVSLPAHGTHNVLNALAAAAVGYCLGLSVNTIVGGLSKFRPANMRSEVLRHGRLTILNDCYNANPASMRAAIDLLVGLGGAKKTIAVLGDMLELGPSASLLHREVGAHVARTGVSELIVCGALGQGIAEGAREAGMAGDSIHAVRDATEAIATLKDGIRGDEVVLVKASRGMRLEQVVEALKGRKG